MFAVQIKRHSFNITETFGDLLINGVFECHTLEDKVREVPCESVTVWKIPQQTAVPSGTYDLTVDMSTRFKRLMPHILNVPGFSGIRIHSGNTDKDTEGCILLGKLIDGQGIVGGTSKPAFNAFFTKLQDAIAAGEKPTITITNEFPAQDVNSEIGV